MMEQIMRTFIASLLAGWFGLVVILGANGAFVRPPEAPPLPILMGASVALIVFIIAYLGSGAFREFVLGADLRLLTAIQAWRAAGLGFLALSTNGVLPGLFAWPAGLGDIAIGVTAPWVVLALIRRPEFSGSRLFVVWNILGILDLVVAVSMGALSSGFVPELAEVSRRPRWHNYRWCSSPRTSCRCSLCSTSPPCFRRGGMSMSTNW
jgi:hypothetical protein